jgi:hypothetical protein
MKTYYTLENGGKKFKVMINKGKFCVYGLTPDKESKNPVYNKLLIKPTTYHKAFIGKDNAKYNIYKEKDFTGNSILINLYKGQNLYMFIGHMIYTFNTSDDVVKKYISIVGNSGVPYPFAIGEKNIYLISEKIFFPKIYNQDPYMLYYTMLNNKLQAIFKPLSTKQITNI